MILFLYNLSKSYAVLVALFLFLSLQCQANESSAIDIFVNSSVPEQQYSISDIRAIFAMKKSYWSDGTRVQVFVLPDNDPLHRNFTKFRLNMFPHQFRRIWDRLIFSGTGRAPHEIKSMEEMLEKISNTPGAIGYLNKQPDNKNIRILNYE